ncbi:GYF domain-containing protein [Haliangium ochraceum]|uniref:MJ0042 family finger-like protein n=1 Tax=Haliangium ochraceum (strain DSM 14365 / JCM 11303 / SMP-2) TaxID=502025 RepID=D0LKN1_HALO1|nr:GYF domain-containing protein [Haliangium ochraceum]ACY15079.1 MJ0042 family finger-like protein [Haliangium ochraceum DSM 14365]
MKFHCHRCNKPYLIADERVRGKILKIRCKSCSTVITVREGMDSAVPSESQGQRSSSASAAARRSSSNLSGGVSASRDSSSNANGEARYRDLGDDWYLSVDGVEEGPFSLEGARDWAAGRPHEESVYCWREGFDDWVPVDEVAEFEGTRRSSRLALMPPPSAPMQAQEPPSSGAHRLSSGSMPIIEQESAYEEAMTTIDPRPLTSGALGPLLRAESKPGAAPAPSGPSGPPMHPAEAAAKLAQQSGAGMASAGGPGSGTHGAADPSSNAAWQATGVSSSRPDPSPSASVPSLAAARPASLANGQSAHGPMPDGQRRGLPMGWIAFAVILMLVAGVGVYFFLMMKPSAEAQGDPNAPPLAVEEVSAYLQRPESTRALQQCYKQARNRDAGQREVSIGLRIQPDGAVAEVILRKGVEAGFATCLRETVGSWRFRASRNGIRTEVPLVFGR